MKLTPNNLVAIAASLLLINTLEVDQKLGLNLSAFFGAEAAARSSGGRSGGGSFRSAPPASGSSRSSSPSTGRSSSPSYSNPSSQSRPIPSSRYPQSAYPPVGYPYDDRDPPRYPHRQNPGTVIVPVPVGPPSYIPPSDGTVYTSSGGDGLWVVGLVLIGAAGLALLVSYQLLRSRSGIATTTSQLDNNTVTVSQVQVALLAQAVDVQAALTTLTLEADTSTAAGLHHLMQESVLLLLRSPENWSHVLASSQTVNSREQAEAIFNQISIDERSKFSVETLSNVGGRLQQRQFQPDPDEDPASYIVVTLLIGSAHDTPLFDEIRTEDTLKESLQKLAAIPPDYLMVFELLWSPQNADDRLTYDELLSEYTDMLQI